jgi:hypothetical protein
MINALHWNYRLTFVSEEIFAALMKLILSNVLFPLRPVFSRPFLTFFPLFPVSHRLLLTWICGEIRRHCV